MSASAQFALPRRRDLFFDGDFHVPHGGYGRTLDPATQRDLGEMALADAIDVDAAVTAGHRAFQSWRRVKPMVRGQMLRTLAQRIRDAAEELAYLDALDTGNPIVEMAGDAHRAAAQIDYFAGLVHEAKGETIPMGADVLNYSLREPLGVIARVVAYNHPLMFLGAKLAAPLAAGNVVIMKAPDQAPLTGYRLAEMVKDIFPPGVVGILSGDRACGEALVVHPLVKKATLIGATSTGIAILKSAADKVMPVILELGGKNPLIICPDANLEKAIEGAVAGMNFTWAGQSCGSTSRCFVHRTQYETVLRALAEKIPARHRCGSPTDPKTTMGCLVSEAQFNKVVGFINDSNREGARLICGGGRPSDPALDSGWFIEATVFADVKPEMRLFREEVFGPILAVIPWDEEEELLEMVNSSALGLTASIWTRDLSRAHRLAAAVESGFIWINNGGAHFIGAEFGGYKRSGMGREEGLSELLAFTQTKNINVAF